MAKMYLEINNGGKNILVTDEHGCWYYASTGTTFGDVDLYPDAESFEDEVMHVLYTLRQGVKAGTIYGAQDVLDDMNDEERAEKEVTVFHGLKTIDDIDKYVNYTYTDSCDHVRRAYYEAYWFEV